MNQLFVKSVQDYIVQISGPANYHLNQWVLFENQKRGIVIKADQNQA